VYVPDFTSCVVKVGRAKEHYTSLLAFIHDFQSADGNRPVLGIRRGADSMLALYVEAMPSELNPFLERCSVLTGVMPPPVALFTAPYGQYFSAATKARELFITPTVDRGGPAASISAVAGHFWRVLRSCGQGGVIVRDD
jgi:hypothetical protein